MLGRMILHLGCLCRGGRWSFHLAGVRRAVAGLSVLRQVPELCNKTHNDLLEIAGICSAAHVPRFPAIHDFMDMTSLGQAGILLT